MSGGLSVPGNASPGTDAAGLQTNRSRTRAPS